MTPRASAARYSAGYNTGDFSNCPVETHHVPPSRNRCLPASRDELRSGFWTTHGWASYPWNGYQWQWLYRARRDHPSIAPSFRKVRPVRAHRSGKAELDRRWDDAVRRYYERRSYGDRRIAPESKQGLLELRPDPESPLVPGFGLSQIKYPYTKRDLEEAEETLGRADRNDDGYIDRSEARRSSWTRTNPFESDFNQDGRLSRLELAQRYASRRLLEEMRDRTYSARRNGEQDEGRPLRQSGRSRESTDGRTRYLADSLMRRYDRNRDRSLELRELRSTGLSMREVDVDQNEALSREELERWLSREMELRADDLTDVLPAWFFERDANGDGQIQMTEFAAEWDEDKLGEFEQLDLNQDGIVTGEELLKSAAVVGGTFANQKAEIMLPRATVVSEIEVTEDYMIGDLNVQLSITHTYASHLDGYLIGPDGQRIELFTGVGRDDDHFDRTVFDDEAKSSITRARPPFQGSFQPEAVSKRQPSLSRYKDKNLKGLWQLMVRANRSDRPGMLHGWSLVVKPVEAPSE